MPNAIFGADQETISHSGVKMPGGVPSENNPNRPPLYMPTKREGGVNLRSSLNSLKSKEEAEYKPSGSGY